MIYKYDIYIYDIYIYMIYIYIYIYWEDAIVYLNICYIWQHILQHSIKPPISKDMASALYIIGEICWFKVYSNRYDQDGKMW